MPLLTINADLTRTASALERIALALERILYLQVHPQARAWMNLDAPQGIEQPRRERHPAGAVTVVTEEQLWSLEREQERLNRVDYQPNIQQQPLSESPDE